MSVASRQAGFTTLLLLPKCLALRQCGFQCFRFGSEERQALRRLVADQMAPKGEESLCASIASGKGFQAQDSGKAPARFPQSLQHRDIAIQHANHLGLPARRPFDGLDPRERMLRDVTHGFEHRAEIAEQTAQAGERLGRRRPIVFQSSAKTIPVASPATTRPKAS